jgi:hypothetical protein
MYKRAIALMLFFGIACAHAQTDSIYVEVLVNSFSIDGDTVNLDTPKEILLKKIGRTEIISVGKINGKELGMQLELVRSSLGKEPMLITGKAFFLKKDGEWQMSNSMDYHRAEFKTIHDKSGMEKRPWGYGGLQTLEFFVSYRERCYFFR